MQKAFHSLFLCLYNKFYSHLKNEFTVYNLHTGTFLFLDFSIPGWIRGFLTVYNCFRAYPVSVFTLFFSFITCLFSGPMRQTKMAFVCFRAHITIFISNHIIPRDTIPDWTAMQLCGLQGQLLVPFQPCCFGLFAYFIHFIRCSILAH